jgi:hypothetical protein
MNGMQRREWLRLSTAGIGGAVCGSLLGRYATAADVGPLETFVPHRQLTHGPRHHWFGYYDKRQFDPANRLVLSNQVDFEHRSPRAEDTIRLGYVDLQEDDRWTEIGQSSAWGWQQGCMLQWVGNRGRTVLWNDRENDRFVCRVLDLDSGERRTLAKPIYTIAPDGSYGLSVDFRRINNLRPGYGYAGLADPHVADRAPEDSGIWRVDLQSGESRLIVSLADVARIAWPDGETHAAAWHYFNHLLVNPSGDRFVFLHRYRPQFDPATREFRGGFVTRMFSANPDGSDLFVLDPSGNTSHFIWDDQRGVTMWTRPDGHPAGFYQMTDRTREVVPVGRGVMTANGHNTNLPAPHDDWVLNDTYPSRGDRRQTVYLFHRPSGRKIVLGHFPSPPQYRGEWRCDTHPRSSNDGRLVVIDSPTDAGRQLHLLDISEIIEA